MREVKIAFVAPGQGISDWRDGIRLLQEEPEIVEPIYHRIKRSTNVDIEKVSLANDVNIKTAVAQPASVGIGYAQAEVLKSRDINPDFVVGLSSGEFAVAAIIGSMTLEKAAIISRDRGVSQDAESGGMGGVVIAIHRSPLDLKSIKEKAHSSYVSNIHNPVMTGFAYLNEHKDELVNTLSEEGAKVRDVKSLTFLPHGPYLKKTQRMLRKSLAKRGTVGRAHTKMISIRDGKIIEKARHIRNSLVWQTTMPTRLDIAMQTAIDNGVEEVYALPPGNTIEALLGYYANEGMIKIMPLSTNRD